MTFVLETSDNRKSPIIATFIHRDILKYSQFSTSDELQRKWVEFAQSDNFLENIHDSLLKYLYTNIAPEIKNSHLELLSSDEDGIILVFINEKYWCELEIKYYGFDMQREDEPSVDCIIVLNFETNEIAL